MEGLSTWSAVIRFITLLSFSYQAIRRLVRSPVPFVADLVGFRYTIASQIDLLPPSCLPSIASKGP